jgi:ubiquinone/menaquinone biosynthesis C-methylase UbiE
MFVPDKPRAFAEVRRVLRPQGQFAFNHSPYFTSDPPTFYEVPFSLHDEKPRAPRRTTRHEALPMRALVCLARAG